jgi:glycosyltransferase involved in cell wall biosynthesis
MTKKKASEKKVLVIAYYFPPMGMGGVQRVAKFVKYLPQSGWEPVVLTVKDVEYLTHDFSLMEDIPEEVKIHRSGSLDPLRVLFLIKKLFKAKNKKGEKRLEFFSERKSKLLSWFLFPDNKIGWLPWALAKGAFLCKKEKIDLIFSTSPPPTAHLIGFFLKLLTNLPWTTDFRDPWVGYQFEYHPTSLHSWLKNKVQRMILTYADAVITDNRKKAEYMIGVTNKIHRLEILPQGFDPEDFSTFPQKKFDYFKIAYLGTFSPDCDPGPFFAALSQLIQENLIPRDKVKFIHIGLCLGLDFEGLIKKYELSGVIERKSYLIHKEALKSLGEADIFLLVISSSKDRELISSGKIFEYMAAKRPILALVPLTGATAQIVKKFNAGKVVSPDNIQEIKEVLFYLYKKFEENKLISETKTDELKFFEKKQLTFKLAKLFEEILQ